MAGPYYSLKKLTIYVLLPSRHHITTWYCQKTLVKPVSPFDPLPVCKGKDNGGDQNTHMQHAMTMRWKRHKSQRQKWEHWRLELVHCYVECGTRRTNKWRKKRGEKEKHFSKVAKVNIIQFIPLKEKRQLLNVIIHVSDHGSVVYHSKFCARLKKMCTYSSYVTQSDEPWCCKWDWFCEQKRSGVFRKERFCSQCCIQLSVSSLLVTLWLLFPTVSYPAPSLARTFCIATFCRIWINYHLSKT